MGEWYFVMDLLNIRCVHDLWMSVHFAFDLYASGWNQTDVDVSWPAPFWLRRRAGSTVIFPVLDANIETGMLIEQWGVTFFWIPSATGENGLLNEMLCWASSFYPSTDLNKCPLCFFYWVCQPPVFGGSYFRVMPIFVCSCWRPVFPSAAVVIL